MALIVKVYINNNVIIDTHAQRISGSPGRPCTYKTDTGHIIKHHYDDGAAGLAIKLLELINHDRDERESNP